jgi:hypothetical protein
MPHCVRSDRSGRYVIDDLLPIETEVHASAASFKPGRWQRRDQAGTRTRVRLRAGQTAKDIGLVLEPRGVLLRGVVKDITGGEIEGARVAIGGGSGPVMEGSAYAFSDAAGEFEQWIAPSDVAVLAETEEPTWQRGPGRERAAKAFQDEIERKAGLPPSGSESETPQRSVK